MRKDKVQLSMGYDFSDSQNRVAAVWKTAFSEHILCSPGIGAEPQQARKTSKPQTAVWTLFAFVLQMHCLRILFYAYCFSIFKMLFFSKKFRSYVLEFDSLETGKQYICSYIYEKSPPWERCFSACWEASQSLEYCKFFAGCASSGRFESSCFILSEIMALC